MPASRWGLTRRSAAYPARPGSADDTAAAHRPALHAHRSRWPVARGRGADRPALAAGALRSAGAQSAAGRIEKPLSVAGDDSCLSIPAGTPQAVLRHQHRSEEHTSELQSLMRISYAVFCLKKKKKKHIYVIN